MDNTRRKIINDYKTKIQACKNRLKATDYKALKFAEGEISAEEYEPIRAERRAMREQINAFERRVNELINGGA